MEKNIKITGARENNLKDIDVEIPRNKLTVVTGVSGSGKSSLVYDVIYKEGHRRFIKSLTSMQTETLEKPGVDMITGLSPVIGISQKRGVINPRSTMATLADLSSNVRLLYSVHGQSRCPYCHEEVNRYSTNQIAEKIFSLNTRVRLLSPINKIHDKSYDYLLTELRNKGIRKILVNDELFGLRDKVSLDENKVYNLEVVADEFIVKNSCYGHIVSAVEKALEIGNGYLKIEVSDGNLQDFTTCEHQMVAGSLFGKHFSSNDISGACSTCDGLGYKKITKTELLIRDENKSLRENPLYISQFSLSDRNGSKRLHSLSKHYGFNMDQPFKELPSEVKDILFYGTNGVKYELLNHDGTVSEKKKHVSYEGLIPYVTRLYDNKLTDDSKNNTYEKLFYNDICPECGGHGLKRERLLVTINDLNISEFNNLRIDELISLVETVESDKKIVNQIMSELLYKFKLLKDIGLSYLNLGRKSDSLSGGEMQRIKLSSQIGSDLMGMIYILDEPSIGLHEKDTYKIIKVLKKLKELGNTVIVVEHDMETVMSADHIIELGPAAGVHGGEIIVSGNKEEVLNHEHSLTGKYLSKQRQISVPDQRRKTKALFVNRVGNA